MIKIIDVDKLFDGYISDFVYKNIGKVKPEEIENEIPRLYDKFGDEKLKELDGKTPNTYYKDFDTQDLISALNEHIKKEISPSDFLIEGIKDKEDAEKELFSSLDSENGEEFTLYAMNILNDLNSSIICDKYLDFILWDYSAPIKEFATEVLCGFADKIKDRIIENFKSVEEDKKPYLTEILSHSSPSDGAFDILIEEFVKHKDEIPVYSGFLSKYGDERAIPFLLTAIESDGINYSDFKELRFAIESLGGEYDKKRDFTHDKVYKKIKEAEDKKDGN